MKTEIVTALKRRATEILAELERDKVPVLITDRGRPAACLVDVETFEDLQRRLAILERIARGEKAVEEGRVRTHDEAKEKMKRWLE